MAADHSIDATPMNTPATVQDRRKGVVAPAQARRMFRMERYLPAPELAPFLDHFWVAEWVLGRPLQAGRLLAPHLPLPDTQVERIAAILRMVEARPGLTWSSNWPRTPATSTRPISARISASWSANRRPTTASARAMPRPELPRSDLT
ncbi:hypothetical protein [Massilia sp. LXY-6]|uniref:hypothetical protein n=1 Tax=Massilia sp. LXY-6 TaxID=3379823 RepID=UPI003F4A571B